MEFSKQIEAVKNIKSEKINKESLIQSIKDKRDHLNKIVKK